MQQIDQCISERLRRICFTVVLLLLTCACANVWAQNRPTVEEHFKSGFPLTGMHMQTECAACHVNGIFKGTPRDCNACHRSGMPLTRSNVAKPQQHFPTELGCESCHTTQSFSGTKFNHAGVTRADCAKCHNSVFAPGKSAGHIVTQLACGECHRSRSTWYGAKADHASFTFATNCGSCHNGTNATGKTANHIPTSINCGNCHTSGGKWTPAKVHSNVLIAAGCANCHATSAFGLTAKPNTQTHVGVSVCESCHRSTTSWQNVQFGHSAANAVGTGTCDTCHNGSSTGTGKNGGHIPVSSQFAKCDTCHKSQTSFAASVTMNHSVVGATACKACHNETYVSQGNSGGAMPKPKNHIPESQLLNGAAMDCNACHSGTTTWTAEKMNHNSSLGNGSGWCVACHATGTNYLGRMERMALNHDKAGQTDCSTSSCHRPLGKKGVAYSKWD
jgi:hypothetical protein